MTSFQNILVPVDFGDAMQAGIDLAVSLAQKYDARLTLVTAFDLTPFMVTTPFAPPIDTEPVIEALEKALADLEGAVRKTWPKTERVFGHGAPQDVILETAAARHCDLIVIGSRGRHGVTRALLGSTAEKVVRFSPIPVLTVHPRPIKKASAA